MQATCLSCTMEIQKFSGISETVLLYYPHTLLGEKKSYLKLLQLTKGK